MSETLEMRTSQTIDIILSKNEAGDPIITMKRSDFAEMLTDIMDWPRERVFAYINMIRGSIQ